MSEKKKYLKFVPGIEADCPMKDEDIWFVFHEGRMFVGIDDGEVLLPRYRDIKFIDENYNISFYLGELEGIKCFAGELNTSNLEVLNFSFSDMRAIFGLMDEETALISSKALELIYWENTNKYCGKCGAKNESKRDERAKICPKCGFTRYPIIAPAIIVAVTKGDKILLAHNKNFKNSMYSVIAGFVEPGETFEECVKREVMEEVSIRVKNIKYFGSQPWPFPNSIMVAFTAEYDGGEIEVDKVEIDHADWYSVDSMPATPRRGSVAKKLIDWFIEQNSQCTGDR